MFEGSKNDSPWMRDLDRCIKFATAMTMLENQKSQSNAYTSSSYTGSRCTDDYDADDAADDGYAFDCTDDMPVGDDTSDDFPNISYTVDDCPISRPASVSQSVTHAPVKAAEKKPASKSNDQLWCYIFGIAALLFWLIYCPGVIVFIIGLTVVGELLKWILDR